MGHRTSVSLEDPFWRAFLEQADREGKSVSALASEIDARRGTEAGLASAIRVYVLEKSRAAAGWPSTLTIAPDGD
jgi:predicted DNA-binding ribbon-helix-helix protein